MSQCPISPKILKLYTIGVNRCIYVVNGVYPFMKKKSSEREKKHTVTKLAIKLCHKSVIGN